MDLRTLKPAFRKEVAGATQIIKTEDFDRWEIRHPRLRPGETACIWWAPDRLGRTEWCIEVGGWSATDVFLPAVLRHFDGYLNA